MAGGTAKTRWLIVLAVYSAITTLALAWLLGRASIEAQSTSPRAADVAATPGATPPVAAAAIAPAATPQSKKPATSYPVYQSTIPKAFRGAWDEIVSDKCEGREARFYFGEREFMNFEVDWEVTKVKLYSPTEIDLHTTTYDENKNQVDEIWEFKLADGGKTLTSRKPGGSFFKRCP